MGCTAQRKYLLHARQRALSHLLDEALDIEPAEVEGADLSWGHPPAERQLRSGQVQWFYDSYGSIRDI